jgi:tetratricopeptide (TPR) repeat protein
VARTWNKAERQRLDALLNELLDLDPADRLARLNELQGADAPLRAELEAMLRLAEDVDGFFTPFEKRAENLRRDQMVGRRVGPFLVRDQIGRGGMGSVYRAERDDGEFQQQVAIKFLSPLASLRDAGPRFQQEKRILASLRHKNIAAIFDAGLLPEGLPYIVMELVDGEPIHEYCSRLELRERLYIFRDVCQAVEYAHQRLVIHRDLKPANIMVTADGAPKLLDFGISKVLDSTVEQTTITKPFLTPAYASPEQVKGGPLTTATDVYSLGLILYELATGQAANRFDTVGLDEQIRQVLHVSPPRPSTVALNPYEAKLLRGDVDKIVAKAIHKEPELRYQSAQQLADDVERFLTGRPVSAVAPSLAYSVGKFIRRNRGLVSLASLGTVLLCGLTWQSVRETARAQAALRQAELARQQAETNARLAEKMRAEADTARLLAERQTQAALDASQEARTQRALAETQRAAADRERELALSSRQEADAQRGLAELRREQAEKNAQMADSRFAELRRLANAVIFDYQNRLAGAGVNAALRAQMVQDSLRYLDSIVQAGSPDPSLQLEMVRAYHALAEAQGGNNGGADNQQGEKESRQRGFAIISALRQANPSEPEVQWWHARFRCDLEPAPACMAAWREIERLRPNDPRTWEGLAFAEFVVAQTQQDLTERLATYGRFIGWYEKLLTVQPDNDRYLRGAALGHKYAASLRYRLQDADGSLRNAKRAVELDRQRFAKTPDMPLVRQDFAISLGTLADAYHRRGDYGDAAKTLAESLPLRRSAYESDPANHWYQERLIAGFSRTAKYFHDAQDFPSAVRYAEEGVSLLPRLQPLLNAPPADARLWWSVFDLHYVLASGLWQQGAEQGRVCEQWRQAVLAGRKHLEGKPPEAPLDLIEQATQAAVNCDRR